MKTIKSISLGGNHFVSALLELKENNKIQIRMIANDCSDAVIDMEEVESERKELQNEIIRFAECPNCGTPAEHLGSPHHKSGFECGRCLVTIPYKFQLEDFAMKSLLKEIPTPIVETDSFFQIIKTLEGDDISLAVSNWKTKKDAEKECLRLQIKSTEKGLKFNFTIKESKLERGN